MQHVEHDFSLPGSHIASGYMTSLQESVDCGGCSSRIDSLQCVACCHPQWRETCHDALVEMERVVLACGGVGEDGGHLLLSHPLSLSRLPPTIIQASKLSFSFLSFFLWNSHPSVLYFKSPSRLSLLSPFFFAGFLSLFFPSHLTSLIIWLPANKSSYLRSVPEEIRVSFIIPY